MGVALTLVCVFNAWAMELKWEFITPENSKYAYVNDGFPTYETANENLRDGAVHRLSTIG